jgi:D-alanine-D-alanine ligase
MRLPKFVVKPRVLVLNNESPDWPEADKQWTDRMLDHLSEALSALGFAHEIQKVYENLDLLKHYDPSEWVLWNWVEELGGRPWSDSLAARAFERRRFAFTGAGSRALAATVDRMRIKTQLIAAGLPTLPAKRISHPRQAGGWSHYPAIVKGLTQHGSFGIGPASVVHDPAGLAERVVWLRDTLASEALVEPFLDSREFHVGGLAGPGGRFVGLPAGEIDYSAFERAEERLFSFDYKHDENTFGYHALKVQVPADIPQRLDRRLRALAAAALPLLGARDYGRIDVRMQGDTPMILDVNVNCDMDSTSVLMRGAAARGWSYMDVIGRILAQTVQRMPPAAVRATERPAARATEPWRSGIAPYGSVARAAGRSVARLNEG